MTRLARCKKCNGTDITVDIDYRETGQTKTLYYVMCNNKSCGLMTQNFEIKQDAIENWNKWNSNRPIIRAKKSF